METLHGHNSLFFDKQVIIVGAGPCGLLLALRLGNDGIPVTILEAASELDRRPRATHYSSPAVIELKKAGISEDVVRLGFHPDIVTWRKPDGTEIAHMPMSSTEIDYPHPMVCLPVSKLGEVLLSHVLKLPNVKVLWNHKVIKTGQNDLEAWVQVANNGTTEFFALENTLQNHGLIILRYRYHRYIQSQLDHWYRRGQQYNPQRSWPYF